ncbi:MAG: tetratricopeptide repeat protein [Bacteroidota bacterium]
MKSLILNPFLFLILLSQAAFGQQEDLFLEARKLYAQKKYEAALPLLEEASKKDKHNSAVWMLLGRTQDQVGQTQAAQESYGLAASALQKELEQVNEHKVKKKTLLRILQTFAQLDVLPKETLGYIEEYREMMHGNVPLKLEELKARTLFEQKKHEETVALVQELLKKEEAEQKSLDMQLLYYLIVESSYQKDDFEIIGKYFSSIESEKYKAKLVHLDPENYYELGYAYFFLYDWDKSHEFLSRALQIKPDYTVARVFFNNLLARQADRKDAITHSHARILHHQEREHDAKYYGDLTKLYILEENYKAAIRVADSCLSITPDNFDIKYLQGVAYLKDIQNDEAIVTFEELVEATEGKVPEEKEMQYFFALGKAYQRAEPEKAPKAFAHIVNGIYVRAAKLELEE